MREKVRHEIEELFMMTSKEQKRIFNKFVSKLDIYQENGLAFDKEKTKKGSSAKMEILD